jgi:hypothetical protein
LDAGWVQATGMAAVIPPGTIIFWTPDNDAAPDAARSFCQSRGLTVDDARIVRREIPDMGKMICVETKQPCRVKLQSRPSAD